MSFVCVCVCVCVNCSVVSNSLQPHGLEPARLLCPWNSPGKNTGVVCSSLLQWIFPTQELNPGLPHYSQALYHLSHQGSPSILSYILYLSHIYLNISILALFLICKCCCCHECSFFLSVMFLNWFLLLFRKTFDFSVLLLCLGRHKSYSYK